MKQIAVSFAFLVALCAMAPSAFGAWYIETSADWSHSHSDGDPDLSVDGYYEEVNSSQTSTGSGSQHVAVRYTSDFDAYAGDGATWTTADTSWGAPISQWSITDLTVNKPAGDPNPTGAFTLLQQWKVVASESATAGTGGGRRGYASTYAGVTLVVDHNIRRQDPVFDDTFFYSSSVRSYGYLNNGYNKRIYKKYEPYSGSGGGYTSDTTSTDLTDTSVSQSYCADGTFSDSYDIHKFTAELRCRLRAVAYITDGVTATSLPNFDLLMDVGIFVPYYDPLLQCP